MFLIQKDEILVGTQVEGIRPIGPVIRIKVPVTWITVIVIVTVTAKLIFIEFEDKSCDF